MKKLIDMTDDSRVWIYQAERNLTPEEVEYIHTLSEEFIRTWDSHGKVMDAAIEVLHNRVIIIAANEAQAQASGCGIDKSVRFIKKLSEQLQLDLFQRTQVLYRDAQGNLNEKPMHEFWAMRKAGLIGDDTIIIDNTIKSVGEWRSAWEVPFGKSWHQEMWAR